jgi:hypothetical protein
MQVDDPRKPNVRQIGSIEPVSDIHQYLCVGPGGVAESRSIYQVESSKVWLMTFVQVDLVRAYDDSEAYLQSEGVDTHTTSSRLRSELFSSD